MSGREAYEEMKKIKPSVSSLLVTGYSLTAFMPILFFNRALRPLKNRIPLKLLQLTYGKSWIKKSAQFQSFFLIFSSKAACWRACVFPKTGSRPGEYPKENSQGVSGRFPVLRPNHSSWCCPDQKGNPGKRR